MSGGASTKPSNTPAARPARMPISSASNSHFSVCIRALYRAVVGLSAWAAVTLLLALAWLMLISASVVFALLLCLAIQALRWITG